MDEVIKIFEWWTLVFFNIQIQKMCFGGGGTYKHLCGFMNVEIHYIQETS